MTPQPAPAPREPRPVVAIIRVSKEGGRGDDLLSPENQRAAISGAAPRRGWRIVEWVEAIDQSGSQRRSSWWPTLDREIRRVESGEIAGIVAWKYSRYARNRLKWAEAVERIDVAGGIIESATEELDATTPAGRFQRGVLGEVNAFQADLIGETWRETHQNRLSRGLPINGRPRFGYTYSREAGFSSDPITGPVLAEAYRRYVAGDSMYALVTWIKGTGTRPVNYGIASKGVWNDTTLRRVLDSGFGAGLLNRHDPECKTKHQSTGNCRRRLFQAGAHQAVIDAATWEAYQAARAERGRPQAARGERSPYLLVGMLRCMADVDGEPCNGRMTYRRTGQRRAGDFTVYCLRAQKERAHRGGQATALYVEAAVLAWMREKASQVEEAVARAAAAAADRGDEIATLDKQIAAAAAELAKQNRRAASGLISDEFWPGFKRELEDNVAQLRSRHKRLTVIDDEPPESVAAEALQDWDTLPVEHQRTVLRRLIDRVEVTTGPLEPVEGAANKARRARTHVVPR